MFLSIIIPAYNEEQRIKKTLFAVNAYLRKQIYSYEIIVVNDGSKDRTADIVETFTEKIPRLRLIDNQINHGKGYAVRQGMLEARGEFRLFMDADGSTSIDEIDTLLAFAWRGYDVVSSSRHAPGAIIEVPQTPSRVALGTIFRWYTHTVVPSGIVDTQNGFKLFSRRAAEEIFSRQTLNRWAFDVEVLAIARLLELSVREVPIHWKNDDRSQMNFKGMVHMALEILQVRLNLWLARYDKPRFTLPLSPKSPLSSPLGF